MCADRGRREYPSSVVADVHRQLGGLGPIVDASVVEGCGFVRRGEPGG